MVFSCDKETDIDNAIFNLKADDDVDDFDRDTGSTSSLSPSEDDHSIASYVAKHRHTVTVQDIRRSDSRFPAGSVCLQVGCQEVQTFNWPLKLLFSLGGRYTCFRSASSTK